MNTPTAHLSRRGLKTGRACRSEARALLDTTPFPQCRELEILAGMAMLRRAALELAVQCPGHPVAERMVELAERLE